jgi:hypothetical protein
MDLFRRCSRRRVTFRRYSSRVFWASHWKGVWDLGTKQEVDTVMRMPRERLVE